MQYTVKKKNFAKRYKNKLALFFDNGDFVYFDGSEIASISVNVYDRLVRQSKGFGAVAESGCIELKIKDRKNLKYNPEAFIYNPQEYAKNRKNYIEKRCTLESKITCILLFDKNNWSYGLLGNFEATLTDDVLRITALPQPQMGGFSSAEHFIELKELTVDDLCGINIDFENCESFFIYSDEITEAKLILDNTLTLSSGAYLRQLRGGYIKLNLYRKALGRKHTLFCCHKPKRKVLESRLCGDGRSVHDIVHLYVDYCYCNYDGNRTECIEVRDIKPQKEIDRLCKEEERDGICHYYFEGGYSQLFEDGTIILTFGKDSKKLLNKLCDYRY